MKVYERGSKDPKVISLSETPRVNTMRARLLFLTIGTKRRYVLDSDDGRRARGRAAVVCVSDWILQSCLLVDLAAVPATLCSFSCSKVATDRSGTDSRIRSNLDHNSHKGPRQRRRARDGREGLNHA